MSLRCSLFDDVDSQVGVNAGEITHGSFHRLLGLECSLPRGAQKLAHVANAWRSLPREDGPTWFTKSGWRQSGSLALRVLPLRDITGSPGGRGKDTLGTPGL